MAKKNKILLVDNNTENFKLVQAALDDAFGVDYYQLDLLTKPEEILKKIVTTHYDVLLFQLYIGDVTGIELAQSIHSRFTICPPIILLTKQNKTNTAVLALEAGISDYLSEKNINSDSLKRSIRYANARHRAQLDLYESKMHIDAMMNSMRDGVVTSNSDGLITSINPAAARLFGYKEVELINTPAKKLIPALLSKKSFYKKYLDTRTETNAIHKKGNTIPIELSISEFKLNDEPMVTCIVHDITERKINEKKIEHQAHYDALTNLPNRHLLLDRLENSLRTTRRYHHNGALLFLDLDNFKHLNDSLGHSIGDNLLQQVAKRLTMHVRDSDTVARLGGDEFVVVLTELDKELKHASAQAHNIAEKIRLEIGKTYDLNGHDYHFTPSIGIALYPNEDATAEDVLRHADAAMYLSKKEGRNTIRFYEPSMQAAADSRLQIEKELRSALTGDEFVLHYQPQISATGQLKGLEVLIRWQHPDKGLIYPDSFLPVAEDACLLAEIGEHVLNVALKQFNSWLVNDVIPADTYIAVNVSPSQFNDEKFVAKILEALITAKVPATNLQLEITENLMIQNVESTISKMQVLKQQGIRLSIDDFGTGYSSMQYLKRLPINQIKIDKSFIHDFTIDPNNAAIVEAIMSMAHHFGLDVVAEGIEAQTELYFLHAKGCDTYQGFYFSKPLPATSIECFLKDNRPNNINSLQKASALFDMSKVITEECG